MHKKRIEVKYLIKATSNGRTEQYFSLISQQSFQQHLKRNGCSQLIQKNFAQKKERLKANRNKFNFSISRKPLSS